MTSDNEDEIPSPEYEALDAIIESDGDDSMSINECVMDNASLKSFSSAHKKSNKGHSEDFQDQYFIFNEKIKFFEDIDLIVNPHYNDHDIVQQVQQNMSFNCCEKNSIKNNVDRPKRKSKKCKLNNSTPDNFNSSCYCSDENCRKYAINEPIVKTSLSDLSINSNCNIKKNKRSFKEKIMCPSAVKSVKINGTEQNNPKKSLDDVDVNGLLGLCKISCKSHSNTRNSKRTKSVKNSSPTKIMKKSLNITKNRKITEKNTRPVKVNRPCKIMSKKEQMKLKIFESKCMKNKKKIENKSVNCSSAVKKTMASKLQNCDFQEVRVVLEDLALSSNATFRKYVIDEPKDKTSMTDISINFSCDVEKDNHSFKEKIECASTDKNPDLNECSNRLNSAIEDYELDAINGLLKLRSMPFKNSLNIVRTENMSVGNHPSSPSAEIIRKPLNMIQTRKRSFSDAKVVKSESTKKKKPNKNKNMKYSSLVQTPLLLKSTYTNFKGAGVVLNGVVLSHNTICSEDDQKITCNIDAEMVDSGIDIDIEDNLSDQVLHKLHGNKSVHSFNNIELINSNRVVSQTDAIPCENEEQANIENSNEGLIDSLVVVNGFKGFTRRDVRRCKHYGVAFLQYLKLKSFLGFEGFSLQEIKPCAGYESVKKCLQKAQQKMNEEIKIRINIAHGEYKILKKKMTSMKVAISNENNKDHVDVTSVSVDEQLSANSSKQVCLATEDNVGDITLSNNWISEQIKKYNIMPVKVLLERFDYKYNSE